MEGIQIKMRCTKERSHFACSHLLGITSRYMGNTPSIYLLFFPSFSIFTFGFLICAMCSRVLSNVWSHRLFLARFERAGVRFQTIVRVRSSRGEEINKNRKTEVKIRLHVVDFSKTCFLICPTSWSLHLKTTLFFCPPPVFLFLSNNRYLACSRSSLRSLGLGSLLFRFHALKCVVVWCLQFSSIFTSWTCVKLQFIKHRP